MSVVGAILLAAGRSRRMGAFKPLLPFGNSTVIETCLNRIREGGIKEVVVVIGHRGDDLRASLARNSAVRFAVNDIVGSKMGLSIKRGIESLPPATDAVLISLVDYPAVTSAVIRDLVSAHEARQATIVQPEWEGRGGHPVLIDLRYREELLNLDSSDGLRGFFRAHSEDVTRVLVTDPFVTRDMDTWVEYCKLHADAFGEPPG